MKIRLTGEIGETEYKQLQAEVLAGMESVLQYRLEERIKQGAVVFAEFCQKQLASLGPEPTPDQLPEVEKLLLPAAQVFQAWVADQAQSLAAEELTEAQQALTDKVQAVVWEKIKCQLNNG